MRSRWRAPIADAGMPDLLGRVADGALDVGVALVGELGLGESGG